MPPMSKLVTTTLEQNGVFLIRCQGYLDDKGGIQLRETIVASFAKGHQRFVLNFKGSPVINSQGVSHLIEIAEIVVEDRHGKLGFVGLSELALNVFKTVDLLRVGEEFSDEEEALSAYRQ